MRVRKFEDYAGTNRSAYLGQLYDLWDTERETVTSVDTKDFFQAVLQSIQHIQFEAPHKPITLKVLDEQKEFKGGVAALDYLFHPARLSSPRLKNNSLRPNFIETVLTPTLLLAGYEEYFLPAGMAGFLLQLAAAEVAENYDYYYGSQPDKKAEIMKQIRTSEPNSPTLQRFFGNRKNQSGTLISIKVENGFKIIINSNNSYLKIILTSLPLYFGEYHALQTRFSSVLMAELETLALFPVDLLRIVLEYFDPLITEDTQQAIDHIAELQTLNIGRLTRLRTQASLDVLRFWEKSLKAGRENLPVKIPDGVSRSLAECQGRDYYGDFTRVSALLIEGVEVEGLEVKDAELEHRFSQAVSQKVSLLKFLKDFRISADPDVTPRARVLVENLLTLALRLANDTHFPVLLYREEQRRLTENISRLAIPTSDLQSIQHFEDTLNRSLSALGCEQDAVELVTVNETGCVTSYIRMEAQKAMAMLLTFSKPHPAVVSVHLSYIAFMQFIIRSQLSEPYRQAQQEFKQRRDAETLQQDNVFLQQSIETLKSDSKGLMSLKLYGNFSYQAEISFALFQKIQHASEFKFTRTIHAVKGYASSIIEILKEYKNKQATSWILIDSLQMKFTQEAKALDKTMEKTEELKLGIVLLVNWQTSLNTFLKENTEMLFVDDAISCVQTAVDKTGQAIAELLQLQSDLAAKVFSCSI